MYGPCMVSLINFVDRKFKKKYFFPIRRAFLREIICNNITIIAIQHSKINFVDTFGDFFHTVE